ncbi:single-stranded-DNA-specific exonuclease RecJ [Aliiglaciecola litoralis]|uniref:Single-stranded-DNA-specific exonuclease RecJ n=1 Tax=Aliiglaciecola litoralis TaxID=582857 RepID=A0ABP3X4D1_9ALTE
MSVTIKRKNKVSDSHLASIPHPVIRQIYANRGIKNVEMLDRRVAALAHYKTLKGIDAAVAVLAEALAQKTNIVIVGDFDADGATSTALMMLCLTRMGAKHLSYLVPNRFDFGYGLSPEIVDVAAQQGANLIITVDNGISCFDGVNRAKELGIKVVITDHHLAADTLPNADAIVNPNQPGCEFLSKNLAGVGVAFYLMLALRSHLKQIGWFTEHKLQEPNLAAFLDIVALGTVADVVPLDNNNRVLVHQGLQRIRTGKCRPGISALIDVAGKQAQRMMSTDLGFVLGPRLNAAGRLDDMSLGIECLLAEDPNTARRMAFELDSLNRERREIQQSMQDEALKALATIESDLMQVKHGIVVYKEDFHQGVIGIVAGKIKEQFNRPTIAFAHQDEQILKGSARSIQGLHIRDLLEEINSRYPQLINKFGGHAMAAGLSIESNNLSAFIAAFEQVSSELLADIELSHQIMTDGELFQQDLSLDFAQQIKDAGPWGQSFPEPIFDGEFDLMEQRLLGGKHLKMMVRHPTGLLLDAIAFNIDETHWPNAQVKKVKLAYKLDINEFRGRISLQLMVDAIQPVSLAS